MKFLQKFSGNRELYNICLKTILILCQNKKSFKTFEKVKKLKFIRIENENRTL